MLTGSMVTIPTSERYFADAGRYLRGNYRIAVRREIIRELIGDPKGLRILDLGCGNGGVSLRLAADNEVILVDNSAGMIAAVREHAQSLGVTGYEAIQSDVTKLDLEPVDLVLAMGLLAHVDSIDAVFKAIAGYLRPGGTAVVQLSDCSKTLTRIALALGKVRGLRYHSMSAGEVLKSAESQGFRLVDQKTHLIILPGLSRLLGPALVPYDRFVRRHPGLASHGTDTVLLLRKGK